MPFLTQNRPRTEPWRTAALVPGLALVLGLALTGPVLAERELHVVAVAEGTPDPEDRWQVPVARVLVDRPGRDVTLVLVDRGPLRWEVSLSPGTGLEQIALGGLAPERSELLLEGLPFPGAEAPALPLALSSRGRPFRELVARASALAGREGIDGFVSRQTAGAAPLVVAEAAPGLPRFRLDHPAHLLGQVDDLPAPITGPITEPPPPAARAEFDTGGLVLWRGEEPLRLPVPEGLPPPVLPAGAGYDPGAGVIYAMAIGGAGRIYRVEVDSGDWAVLAGLEGYDGAAILPDPAGQRLILTGAFARPGDIRIQPMDGGPAAAFSVPVTAIPGLTDLYDHGNEDAPSLIPVSVAGDWVRLEATAPGGLAWRHYALNLATRQIRLIGYQNGW